MAYNFDTIAPTYDRLNHLMTLGLDRRWRHRAARQLSASRSRSSLSVLDVACGTGDLTLELLKRGCQVTGIDLSEEMLEIARQKTASANAKVVSSDTVSSDLQSDESYYKDLQSANASSVPSDLQSDESYYKDLQSVNATPTVSLQLADAEHLPFADATFDAVTCAFGIRNFVHLEQGLSEMTRVLKPGGVMVILEMSTPDNPFVRPFYNIYTKRIIPWLGQCIAGSRDAYTYLPSSIECFPKGKVLLALLESQGLQATQKKHLFGVCRRYRCTKPNQQTALKPPASSLGN